MHFVNQPNKRCVMNSRMNALTWNHTKKNLHFLLLINRILNCLYNSSFQFVQILILIFSIILLLRKYSIVMLYLWRKFIKKNGNKSSMIFILLLNFLTNWFIECQLVIFHSTISFLYILYFIDVCIHNSQ